MSDNNNTIIINDAQNFLIKYYCTPESNDTQKYNKTLWQKVAPYDYSCNNEKKMSWSREEIKKIYEKVINYVALLRQDNKREFDLMEANDYARK